ncbi:ArsR/SmtB family transcription factor [Dokdonella immobilis]|uniref:Transcriptional regulator, ArsR family n=1 Tax=Dokdonella immobilis TaxID=578942 RepID=A0A1I4W2R0_9GAMM|nr:metalloregulator ArsR/SmtB family transcription factor [Dokdonella immobilis]SFN07369.1 transcriptional regulator, ArsR family [Dokdonella immobilis]
MSSSASARRADTDEATAAIFAALGDGTRLALVARLSQGSACSISQLAEHSALTRQAITKHLQVLEKAGLVSRRKSGRETLYACQPRPLHDARRYLDVVERQWDQALGRLKTFIER